MFADACNLPLEKLEPSTKLREAGEIDSLSLGEFFASVEDQWSITIPDRLCSEFQSLGDVIHHVQNETGEQYDGQ